MLPAYWKSRILHDSRNSIQASNPVLVLKPDSKGNVGTDIPLSSHILSPIQIVKMAIIVLKRFESIN